ncbi:hypothetical protein HNY73_011212 [Argiope bruennichi]|uniref:Uncharacterized protein n=1 Tax=Argiope bruennichi TaxID=94029 RepID=A0A8T0F8E6_ARGBR|nr:hypothetical protein HNY73_011212 [Argiope bruennichi]
MSSKTSDFQEKVEVTMMTEKQPEHLHHSQMVLSQTPLLRSDRVYCRGLKEQRSYFKKKLTVLHNLILQTKPSDCEIKVEKQQDDRRGSRTSSTVQNTLFEAPLIWS